MATQFPLPSGTNTTFPTGSNPKLQAMLAQLVQALKAGAMPRPGAAGTPVPGARVGGPPPNFSGGPPMPSLGQPSLGVGVAGGGSPEGPGFTAIPGPSGQQTGFGSRGEAASANVHNIFTNIVNAANVMEKRSYDKKADEAAYITRELEDARASGDTARYNWILEQPRTQKILKAVKGYSPYEINEKPPEVAGVEKHAAQAQQRGQAQQPKMSISPTAQQQIAALLQQKQLETLKSDPEALKQAAMGTSLSPGETRSAELFQAGLAVSPVLAASMDAKASEAYLDRAAELTKAQLRAETDLKISKNDIERAKIMSGVGYAKLSLMQSALQGKDDGEVMKLIIAQNKDIDTSVSSLRGMAKSRYSDAVKALNAGNDDEYKKAVADSKAIEKQASELEEQRSGVLDLLMQKRLAKAEAIGQQPE